MICCKDVMSLTWKSFLLSFFFLELVVIFAFQPQSSSLDLCVNSVTVVLESMNARAAATSEKCRLLLLTSA
jgi:hypothetical protein